GQVFPPGGDGSTVYRELAADAVGPKGAGRGGYRVRHDPVTGAYSLWNPATRVFIGYDDPRAVIAKGRYATRQHLAGVFAWELSQDNGDLLNAMNLGVGNRPQP
uniref:glycosyl hydrolase family 18 protein n=1 Tax=Pelomonas sp. KK5 TaxID=1855730 RepID=UPI001E296426